MAINTKAIKSRIKSVTNTKKITKAMEMVSAAKMRRAVAAALGTRDYARLAQELLQTLAYLGHKKHPLLHVRPAAHVLIILLSSNRGLCGSFNSNMFRRVRAALEDTATLARQRRPGKKDIMPKEAVTISLLGVGKKSAFFAKKYGYPLVGVYDAINERPTFTDTAPISSMIIREFLQGTYDKVVVAYTDFVSSLAQQPKLRQLLPLSPADLQKMLEALGRNSPETRPTTEAISAETAPYPIGESIFEPNQSEILDYILPRLVEIQLYQAVLETAASEHSARMLAMRNASDAAEEMIDDLRMSFNKARQAGITQEIAEIAGGAAALG